MKTWIIFTVCFLILLGFSHAREEERSFDLAIEQDCAFGNTNLPLLRAKSFVDKEGFVNNNGVKIHYHITGTRNAPPIVLIHAFPLDSQMYRCQVRALSDAYRIITIDLRGYGKSESSPTNDYSIEAFISDVRAVVNKLEIKNPVLGGSSLGSVVAQVYVATFQDVSKLLLFSPYVQVSGLPLGLDPAVFTEIIAGLLIDRQAQLAAIIEAQTPEICRQIRKIRSFLTKMANRASTEALVGSIQQAFPVNTSSILNLIQIPTLIMFGTEDSLENRLGIYFLRDHIVNSRIVEFPGGHVFNLTQSKIVNNVLLNFLKENDAQCPTCLSN